MSDLVERLRSDRGAGAVHWADCREAADEIDRLRQDCAEAYQVVGALAHYSGLWDTDDVNKALDNFGAASNGEPRLHHDLLPFPKSLPTGYADELARLHAENERLTGRIAEMEGEIAELDEDYCASMADNAVQKAELRATADTATRALSDLRAALAPFARYAKREMDKTIPRHIQDDPHTPVLASGNPHEDRDAVEVFVSDFQRLAALSQDLTADKEGEDNGT